jgi:hypothetical protein
MLKIINISVIALIGALSIGCSDDDGGSSNLTGSTVEITSEQEAKNAVAAISSTSNFTDGLDSYTAPTKKATSFKAVSLATERVDCSYGGSMEYNGEYSDYTVSFNDCKMTSNMTASGSGAVKYSETDTYDIYEISYSNFSLDDSYHDYNLKYNLSMKLEEQNVSPWANKATMNGTLSITSSSDTMKAGFENFRTYSDTTGKITLDGKISNENSLNECANGIYELETVEDLASNYYGDFIDGKLKVNGATFTFNADGSADVIYADGSSGGTIQPSDSVVCD